MWDILSTTQRASGKLWPFGMITPDTEDGVKARQTTSRNRSLGVDQQAALTEHHNRLGNSICSRTATKIKITNVNKGKRDVLKACDSRSEIVQV